MCLYRGNLIYFPITTSESRKCFPALSNLGVIIKIIIKFILLIFLPSGLQSYTVYCPVSKHSLSLFFFNVRRFSLVACTQLQLEAVSSISFFFFLTFLLWFSTFDLLMPIVFSAALALYIKALSCLLISLTLLHFSTYFFLLAIDHSILFFLM